VEAKVESATFRMQAVGHGARLAGGRPPRHGVGYVQMINTKTAVSTINTSDTELMLSTYMVTPTSTGGPATDASNNATSDVRKEDHRNTVAALASLSHAG